MNSDPHRRQDGVRWWAKAIVFSIAAASAGFVFGWFLGAAGSNIPVQARLAAVSVLAVVGVLIGMLDFGSLRLRLVEHDRETSQAWMKYGALRWAALNGAALGIGITSRIEFWLWFAVPVGALLCGEPLLGGLIYGLYGLARGGSIWLVLLGTFNRVSGDDPSSWLLAQRGRARLVTSAQLVMLATATAIVVGL